MALLIEVFTDDWQPMGEISASDPPGSFSHNPEDGPREMLMFYCHGDRSTIERSLGGGDAETGPYRIVTSIGTELVAELRDGESHEMFIRPDNYREERLEGRRVRFTHRS